MSEFLDRDKLTEALAFHTPVNPGQERIWAAACWVVDLFEKCENCGGKGEVRFGIAIYDDGDVEVKDCPACGGRGYDLNPEAVERAAYQIHRDVEGPSVRFLEDTCPCLDVAETAILAFLAPTEEERP